MNAVTERDLKIARAIVEVAEKSRFDDTAYLTVMDLEKGFAAALALERQVERERSAKLVEALEYIARYGDDHAELRAEEALDAYRKAVDP